ncbi:MAG: MOSC domain-containing protein [Cetobacterium sp.]|uniref:MOSC domain-containing protein n=1 Tax=Cetobacterium sp. TaxID=2071632 RepID=UPI002FCA6EE9
MCKVLAVCISEKKGTGKTPVEYGTLIENFGFKDDAHAGDWHRQVSLLAVEKIDDFRDRGGKVSDGDFGENLIIQGIDLSKLPVGTKLSIKDSILEITQIGKECHTRCNIFYTVGDCIMPREGIFARVLKGGVITAGNNVNLIP